MNVEYTAAHGGGARRDRGGQGQPPEHAEPVLEEVREGPRSKRQEGDEGRQGHGGARPTRSATSAASRWSSSGAATASSWPAPATPSARTPASSRAARARAAPEVHEDVAQGGLPQGRPAHGAQEGALRALPRLHQLPGVQGPRSGSCAARAASCRSSSSPPSTRSARSAATTSCGAAGRFGPFIACSNYPTCKYIKKKEAREIGLLCPDCGQGQVVERKGRWGRFFYGCRRYPECKFTAYHKPIAEPCPDCGRPYLLEKETKKEGKVVFCGNESLPLQARRGLRTPTRRGADRAAGAARSLVIDRRPWPTRVTIVGGGLAGCEAAWQLARRGVGVDLYEMRPARPTPVHQTGDLAELVCSNSLRGNALDQAAGLLKEEMRRLDSLVMRVADEVRVPAGSALAVDRGPLRAADHGGRRGPPGRHAPPGGGAADPRRPRERSWPRVR